MAEEGLAELNALAENANAQQKMQISLLKVSLLINGGKLDDAVAVLGEITEAEDTEPETLNQLSWMIYEAAKEGEDFPKPVVEAATAAAKKAVEGAPDNGMILDTYAHLLHLQGDLDQAVKVQSKAVENLADASEEATADIKAFLKQLKKEQAKAKE
jgi:ATP-dependent Clp protease ATP-binding subunit ClpA